MFRVGLVVTSWLVPQFLARVHGYRPLEISELMLWAAIPQIATLPLVWKLMHLLERRLVMALGLLLCAFATVLLVDGTGLSAAEDFRLTLVIFAVGQLVFLAPVLVAGTSALKPADLPTASIAFNVSTVGGTTLGVGLMSNLVTEREKFHSNVITEAVSLYNALDADRVANVAAVFANRIADDATAAAKAAAVLASLRPGRHGCFPSTTPFSSSRSSSASARSEWRCSTSRRRFVGSRPLDKEDQP